MAGIELEGDNDDAANLVNELLAEPPGAKYLGFFSSRSLKMREKYTNWDNLVCLSLYIFEHRAIYVYFYKILLL